MIMEKSCGAVVFTVKNGQRLYLVEHMVKGHTSICKGHVEGAETERETAAREIREETALTVTFLEGFRRTIRYSPYPGCVKDVVFFLAKARSTDTAAQPEEVRSLQWLSLEDALVVLTHQSDRETVLAADRFLNDRPEYADFRPMRRRDRAMDREKCLEILEKASSGVLSLVGDGGWPYGVPLSYVYHDGRIYFHGARTGHKLDAARSCPRGSFCVVDRDDVDRLRYATSYRSVIVFGALRELTGEAELRAAVELLATKYNPTDTPEHRQKYIDAEFKAMAMLELTVEHMTGKARDQ